MSFELADVASIYIDDPNSKKQDVDLLFDWLKTQPHLPELTELQAVLFLHSCYYQLDAAKTTIENYFTFRSKSGLLQNVTEELIRRTLSSFFIGFMPKRTPEGDAVLLMKMLDCRPEIYNCTEHAKVLVAVITLYYHKFGPANGLIVVSDMEGTSFGHLFRFSLSVLKQLTYFVQEAAPTRLKSVHHINAIPITERMISIAKPFLKTEVYNMFKFHPHSFESFYQYVPKECLPEEYGGKLSPILELSKNNVQTIIENLDFLQWHNTQKTDETKRITKGRRFFW